MIEKLQPFDVTKDEFISREINSKDKDYLTKLVEKLNEVIEKLIKEGK